jgi:type I restriction enzyme S subunit
MKAGWQLKAIGAVCDVVNGGTPKTGVSEYWDGPHQWITPAEMGKRASPYIAETERTITDLGLQNSSARMLPPHSVILSSRAPIGHLVINTETMATNQGCKGLVPDASVEHKFLYYYLTSIVGLLNDLGTGATFKELSGGKLKEVTIPVPPKSEQRRIVSILDEVFDGIATAKAGAEKNLQNARALFESQLQSIFAQKHNGWIQTTIGDQLTLQRGFDITKGQQGAGEVDLLPTSPTNLK